MARKGGFFKSNWAYLIWFIFYFLISVFVLYGFIQNIGISVLLSTLLYVVCIGLALSPIGEFLVRLMENLKPIQTQQDLDYILPLFEEVYEEAQNYSPKIDKDIRLFISESLTVNAFATGRKTIAITRGAIYAFSHDELKGVLAHELGHVVNGDTKALSISLVGNGFFSLLVLILKIIMNVLQATVSLLEDSNLFFTFISLFVYLLRMVIDFLIFLFTSVGDIILALNSRYSEYLADEYAFSIGYGEDLKSALYILKQLSIPAKTTLTERLKASHPYIAARIKNFEQLQMQSA